MKGKRILIITDSVYPNLTMNGIIMKNLTDYLIKDNQADIISYKSNQKDVSEYKGIKIHFVKSFPFFIYSLRDSIKTSRSIKQLVYRMMLLAVRSCSLLCRIAAKDGINHVTAEMIKAKICHLADKKRYDFIVCIGVPFESFLAAYKISQTYKNIKIIAYQVDDFVKGKETYFPRFLLARKEHHRRILLNRFAESFYRYVMTEAVYKNEICYVKKRKKIQKAGIPLLVCQSERLQNISAENKDSISLSYLGSLTKGVRSPEGCLDIMLHTGRMQRISLNFYHRGDCADIIRKYEKRSNGMIKDHGTVSTKEAYDAMCESDILIAISSYEGDQVSGKTFDYFSMGKPVIFFYYKEEDINLPFYEKYELGLPVCIKESDIDSNTKKVCSFIDRCIGKKVSFETVERLFYKYTPDCVANELFGNEFI